MYNENSFSNYIFWLKVRRAFLLFIFSIIGCIIGIFISQFVIEVLILDQSVRFLIVTVSTLLFFCIALLLTMNTGKEIQDGYWKMAVLRKLTVISKKLDNISETDIDELNTISDTVNNIHPQKSNTSNIKNKKSIKSTKVNKNNDSINKPTEDKKEN